MARSSATSVSSPAAIPDPALTTEPIAIRSRRKKALSAVPALFLALTLAACGGQPMPADGEMPATGTAPSSAQNAPPPAPTTRQASLPRPEIHVPKPADLIGLDADRITDLLGAPVFVRRDPPAEYWRYNRPDCILELIFYKKDGQTRLSYIETRRGGTDRAASEKCLRSVVESRAAPKPAG